MGFTTTVLSDIGSPIEELMFLASTCAIIGFTILMIRRGLFQDETSGSRTRSFIRYGLLVASIYAIPQLVLWVLGMFDLESAKTIITNTIGG